MFIVPITRMPEIESLDHIKKKGASQGQSEDGQSFQSVLDNMLSEIEENQKLSGEEDLKLAAGGVDDLHSAIIQAEQTAAAVEFTTQLTSRAVSAYNQIMGMQV